MSLEDLMSIEGIDEALAQKLIAAGVENVVALASKTYQWLLDSRNDFRLNLSQAKQIIEAARERCDLLFPFISGPQVVEEAKRYEYLTSGTRALDAILADGKGFQTQRLYELYGEGGGGKSDLLHQLLCTAQLPSKKGGLGTGGIYIDIDGSFSPEKLKHMAPRFKLKYDTVRAKIVRIAPSNTEDLRHLCQYQLERLAYEKGARLICLDNLATLFQAEYTGLGDRTPERSARVGTILNALRQVAIRTNGISIYTNQMTNPKYGNEPVLGTYLKHAPTVRFLVSIGDFSKGRRIFSLVKDIDQPPSDAELTLGSKGFMDV